MSIGAEFLGKYVMIRSNRSGVFAGTLDQLDGSSVILKDARRMWSWQGAASLSQLAEEGTSKPEDCQFPIPVSKVMIFDVIEIIAISEKAEKSIAGVKIWSL